jgi:hypothetical protein
MVMLDCMGSDRDVLYYILYYFVVHVVLVDIYKSGAYSCCRQIKTSFMFDTFMFRIHMCTLMGMYILCMTNMYGMVSACI